VVSCAAFSSGRKKRKKTYFFSVIVVAADNLNTTQTPECTKDKYNAKINK
jgi:hypothetical protein